MPVGIPVPGKPGLVYSPYAKGKIMNVSIYKRGEVVLCPYTAKPFRAPKNRSRSRSHRMNTTSRLIALSIAAALTGCATAKLIESFNDVFA